MNCSLPSNYLTLAFPHFSRQVGIFNKVPRFLYLQNKVISYCSIRNNDQIFEIEERQR